MIAALLFVLSVSGCASGSVEPTCRIEARHIEAYRGTVDGPARIDAALRDEELDLELRARAGLALLELERRDVDGFSMLNAALPDLEPELRQRVLHSSVAWVEATLVDTTAAEATQRRAVRAARTLAGSAGDGHRTRLLDATFGWLTAEPSRLRDEAGSRLGGLEATIAVFGAPAVERLIDALEARRTIGAVAGTISEHAEGPLRTRAAERLMAIERERHGPEVRQQIRQAVLELVQERGTEARPAMIDQAVVLNRESLIEDAIASMSQFADEDAVRSRLLEIADDTQYVSQHRAVSLRGLEGHVTTADADRLLALALDDGLDLAVRDYAFDRVSDTGSPRVAAALWPLMSRTDHDRLRWRVGEIVLASEGRGSIARFLDALPARGATFRRDELEGYARRIAEMTPAPVGELVAALDSNRWHVRVVCLLGLARIGTALELPAIERLRDDSAQTEGELWEELTTVGDVARHAAAQLRDRTTGP